MGHYKAKDGTDINTDLRDELQGKDAWIADDGTIFSREKSDSDEQDQESEDE